MNVHLTPISGNSKTGPIPVTTSSAETCPDACPLKVGGCYAKSGPLGLHWAKVSSGERGTELDILCRQIEAFPEHQLWRHNQSGDLPGVGDTIDVVSLHQLVKANKGRRGFTYTHKPVEGDDAQAESNRDAVRSANANGFTINLSGNNLPHADRLAQLDAGPVVTLVSQSTPDTFYTPQGRKGIVCPAQQREDITCASCQLCSRSQRSVIIGFRPHGTGKKKAEAVATNANL